MDELADQIKLINAKLDMLITNQYKISRDIYSLKKYTYNTTNVAHENVVDVEIYKNESDDIVNNDSNNELNDLDKNNNLCDADIDDYVEKIIMDGVTHDTNNNDQLKNKILTCQSDELNDNKDNSDYVQNKLNEIDTYMGGVDNIYDRIKNIREKRKNEGHPVNEQ